MGAWDDAYASSFESAWQRWPHGDWLVPLVYAARENDDRLARALLAFARERASSTPDEDAALAVLEVAEATLAGHIEKDVCKRVADNLRVEAFETALRDQRFDRYFGAHCISAAARLAANVHDPRSAKDAVEVIQAAVRQSVACSSPNDADAVRHQAATRIRGAIPAP